jgi:hypothetical protein
MFKKILFLLGPMLIVANTELTYNDTSIFEDLSDVIYDISPSETPIFSSLGRDKAENTFFEWQIDELPAPVSTNAQLEGDDVTTFEAVARPTRLGNRQQISRKTLVVGGTTEAVSHAGIASVEGRDMARKMKVLKLDIEKTIQENQGAVAGDETTPRKTGSLLAFIKTNTDVGATGTDPVYTTEPTDPRNDGTQRAFTDTILKTVLQKMWEAGASVSDAILYLGAFNKAAFSAFSSQVTRQISQSKPAKAAVIAAADIYVGEFGTTKVVPNRWGRARDGLLLDSNYAKVAYLRPFKREDLAKTGDAKKAMIIVEWGLKVTNEAAHGLCADLTTV